ncbi:hypothetical protein [Campylobacter troglodytis]|uniref:hypothetical protein n=1 Tax=Campylobacter troglodytis TaxID=654363 RepID=UPI00115B8AE3|nr:hypothetical protein [Campylobacter troglodytis]TQR60894.1 hypothetical protein DMC01_03475 [Campylobacter troglodytis]
MIKHIKKALFVNFAKGNFKVCFASSAVRNFARRYAKTQRLCLHTSAKTLFCQRITAYYKGLYEA